MKFIFLEWLTGSEESIYPFSISVVPRHLSINSVMLAQQVNYSAQRLPWDMLSQEKIWKSQALEMTILGVGFFSALRL